MDLTLGDFKYRTLAFISFNDQYIAETSHIIQHILPDTQNSDSQRQNLQQQQQNEVVKVLTSEQTLQQFYFIHVQSELNNQAVKHDNYNKSYNFIKSTTLDSITPSNIDRNIQFLLNQPHFNAMVLVLSTEEEEKMLKSLLSQKYSIQCTNTLLLLFLDKERNQKALPFQLNQLFQRVYLLKPITSNLTLTLHSNIGCLIIEAIRLLCITNHEKKSLLLFLAQLYFTQNSTPEMWKILTLISTLIKNGMNCLIDSINEIGDKIHLDGLIQDQNDFLATSKIAASSDNFTFKITNVPPQELKIAYFFINMENRMVKLNIQKENKPTKYLIYSKSKGTVNVLENNLQQILEVLKKQQPQQNKQIMIRIKQFINKYIGKQKSNQTELSIAQLDQNKLYENGLISIAISQEGTNEIIKDLNMWCLIYNNFGKNTSLELKNPQFLITLCLSNIQVSNLSKCTSLVNLRSENIKYTDQIFPATQHLRRFCSKNDKYDSQRRQTYVNGTQICICLVQKLLSIANIEYLEVYEGQNIQGSFTISAERVQHLRFSYLDQPKYKITISNIEQIKNNLHSSIDSKIKNIFKCTYQFNDNAFPTSQNQQQRLNQFTSAAADTVLSLPWVPQTDQNITTSNRSTKYQLTSHQEINTFNLNDSFNERINDSTNKQIQQQTQSDNRTQKIQLDTTNEQKKCQLFKKNGKAQRRH